MRYGFIAMQEWWKGEEEEEGQAVDFPFFFFLFFFFTYTSFCVSFITRLCKKVPHHYTIVDAGSWTLSSSCSFLSFQKQISRCFPIHLFIWGDFWLFLILCGTEMEYCCISGCWLAKTGQLNVSLLYSVHVMNMVCVLFLSFNSARIKIWIDYNENVNEIAACDMQMLENSIKNNEIELLAKQCG